MNICSLLQAVLLFPALRDENAHSCRGFMSLL
jgi:hypothetical protein